MLSIFVPIVNVQITSMYCAFECWCVPNCNKIHMCIIIDFISFIYSIIQSFLCSTQFIFIIFELFSYIYCKLLFVIIIIHVTKIGCYTYHVITYLQFGYVFILANFEFEFYQTMIEFHNYGRFFYSKLHNECWEFATYQRRHLLGVWCRCRCQHA